MIEPVAAKPRSTSVRWLRLLPWASAAVVLALLLWRIPLDEVLAAVGRGPVGWLALYTLLEAISVLPADAWATRVTLSAAGVQRPFGELFLVRGSTYLLNVLSYAVGQGGLGIYLARTGVGAARSAGVVLFLLATNAISLALVAAIAHPFAQRTDPRAAIAIGVVLYGVKTYLTALAARGLFARTRFGRWMATHIEKEPVATLARAGLLGHLKATAARIPHVAVLLVALWGSFRVWGIEVPLGVGLAALPAVVLIAALPITPSGLGTAQALQVLLFAPYVAGATPAIRSATLLGFSLVHHGIGLVAQALVGTVCFILLKRRGIPALAGSSPSPEEAAPEPEA
ncbi:MAG TPA: lysylphosphatidylglycerol synthase domain-containing protein [Thermoanaerobaculia bacterium]|nr:lysylphosphatidylglycerol synthase domain-containing protein [Thermoanaerobaculia bacterium]